MKQKLSLFLLFFLFTGFVAFSQVNVSGKVTNKANGDPIPSVSVTVKGGSQSAVTGADGTYAISVPLNSTLLFTAVGHAPVNYVVRRAGVVDIQMEATAVNMNEVVVIGYGTQKVTKVSGALSAVKGSDIDKAKPTRVDEALQGRASGVTVIQGGSPGSQPTVIIRGIPSNRGNSPLVVIDGVQQSQADLNAISSTDIESINVLKDAAAAAIYGVNAGNGVILVTTKSGRKNQKADITLGANYGIQDVIQYMPMLNATEYAAMVNEGSVLSGGNVVFPDISKLGVGTNWQKEVFQKSPVQTYSVSARGGTERVTYYLAGGYFSQAGIVGGYDKSRFNRINFTSNLNFELTPKLKFLLNANWVNLDNRGVQENSFNSILGSAINYDPTVPVYNDVPNTIGQYGFSTRLLSEIFNPLTKLENTYNRNDGNKYFGKFETQYSFLKDLKLTSRFGYSKYDYVSKSFNPLVFWGLNNVDNSLDENGNTVASRHNSVSHGKGSYNMWQLENFVNYNFKVADAHTFETTVGMGITKSFGSFANMSRQDVPYNSWQFADFNAATGINTATNSTAVTSNYDDYVKRNLTYFGRINYDYKEKYLASVTVRRDGSTSFGKDKKFAIFPSGSLGWVVSKEDFFKSKVVDFFKIRGSYGVLGNDNTTQQYARISSDYLALLYGSGNHAGYTFGNTFYSGSTLSSITNAELGWEEQKQLNAGAELIFLRNKFTVNGDYYRRETNGLIFKPSLPWTMGTVPAPDANVGSVRNSGVDITLGYNEKLLKTGTFNTTFTITTVKSLVTKTNGIGYREPGGYYFNGQSQNVTWFEEGKSPGYFYGYKTAGLFQSWDEIAKSPAQPGAQPGDIKFIDINGDSIIDAKDQTQIGNPFPKATLGWNVSAAFKGFDFSVFTYASIGNDVYRAFDRNANFTNKFRDILGRWTGPGTTNDARYPRYSFTDANNNARVSDRFVEDGSFVKIKNIVVGYTIPTDVAKWFKSVRIYGQVKNAFIFTKYTGFDPEVSGGLFDTGIDRGSYPQPRVFSFGIDVKLK